MHICISLKYLSESSSPYTILQRGIGLLAVKYFDKYSAADKLFWQEYCTPKKIPGRSTGDIRRRTSLLVNAVQYILLDDHILVCLSGNYETMLGGNNTYIYM